MDSLEAMSDEEDTEGDSDNVDLRSCHNLLSYLNSKECISELEKYKQSEKYLQDSKAFSYTHLTDSEHRELSKYIANEDMEDQIYLALMKRYPSLKDICSNYVNLNRGLAVKQFFYNLYAEKHKLA